MPECVRLCPWSRRPAPYCPACNYPTTYAHLWAKELQDLRQERNERVRDRMAYWIANRKDLNLTEGQKAQIAQIRKEYRPKVQEAGNKLRATVREEVEAILAVIKG